MQACSYKKVQKNSSAPESFYEISPLVPIPTKGKNASTFKYLNIFQMGKSFHFERGDSYALCETVNTLQQIFSPISNIEANICKLQVLEDFGLLKKFQKNNSTYLSLGSYLGDYKIQLGKVTNKNHKNQTIFHCRDNAMISYINLTHQSKKIKMYNQSNNSFIDYYEKGNLINTSIYRNSPLILSMLNAQLQINNLFTTLIASGLEFSQSQTESSQLGKTLFSLFPMSISQKRNALYIGDGISKNTMHYIGENNSYNLQDTISTWDATTQIQTGNTQQHPYYSKIVNQNTPKIPTTVNQLSFDENQIWDCHIPKNEQSIIIDVDLGGIELQKQFNQCDTINFPTDINIECLETLTIPE